MELRNLKSLYNNQSAELRTMN